MSFSCLNERGYIGSMTMRGRRDVSRMPSSRSNSQVRFCCAIRRRCSLLARRGDHALHGLQLLVEKIAQAGEFVRRRRDRSRRAVSSNCGRENSVAPFACSRKAGRAARASCPRRFPGLSEGSAVSSTCVSLAVVLAVFALSSLISASGHFGVRNWCRSCRRRPRLCGSGSPWVSSEPSFSASSGGSSPSSRSCRMVRVSLREGLLVAQRGVEAGEVACRPSPRSRAATDRRRAVRMSGGGRAGELLADDHPHGVGQRRLRAVPGLGEACGGAARLQAGR